MKKRLIGVMALAVGAAISSLGAKTDFCWYDQFNELKNQNNQGILIGDATVLTFVSEDSTTVGAWNAVSDGKLILQNEYGNDAFYLGKGTIDYDGYYLTEWMTDDTGAHVGKYIYAIILNFPFANYSALGSTEAERFANIPRNGTVYAGITAMGDIAGTVTALVDTGGIPPAPPQSFHGGNVITNLQIIPEPSSAGLLFGTAGVLAAVVGRRIRRR